MYSTPTYFLGLMSIGFHTLETATIISIQAIPYVDSGPTVAISVDLKLHLAIEYSLAFEYNVSLHHNRIISESTLSLHHNRRTLIAIPWQIP